MSMKSRLVTFDLQVVRITDFLSKLQHAYVDSFCKMDKLCFVVSSMKSLLCVTFATIANFRILCCIHLSTAHKDYQYGSLETSLNTPCPSKLKDSTYSALQRIMTHTPHGDVFQRQTSISRVLDVNKPTRRCDMYFYNPQNSSLTETNSSINLNQNKLNNPPYKNRIPILHTPINTINIKHTLPYKLMESTSQKF